MCSQHRQHRWRQQCWLHLTPKPSFLPPFHPDIMSLMSSTVALLCCLAGLAHTAHGAQRVAVIGGGVAGASAAYYTRKALGADAVIEA